MRHPADSVLALYTSGDLPGWRQWATSVHIGRCSECRQEVESYRRTSNALVEAFTPLPKGVQWDGLADEMAANIHVGLEAGECVGNGHSAREKIGWKAVLVAASITLVVSAGWFLNAPARRAAESPGMVIEANRTAIELKHKDTVLSLPHRGSGRVALSASGPGVVEARYFNGDTGQVTITHVYAE